MKIWNGIIQSEAEPNGKYIFSEATWIDRQVESLNTYLNQISSSNLPTYPPRYSTLPMVYGIVNGENILDFGGGNGWTFHYLATSVDITKLNMYYVYENKSLVSKLNQLINPIEKLNYSDKIPDGNIDFLYSNSALQYVSDEDFLSVVKLKKPNYVLLDNFLANQKQFFTEQNYYDQQISVKFRNLEDFAALFSAIGYRRLWVTPYYSMILGQFQSLKMENFPSNYQIDRTFSILFQKI